MTAKLTMGNLIIRDPERLRDYNARVKEARIKFNTIGRGARALASRELGISSTVVTTILNGHKLTLAGLIVLEEWLEKNFHSRMVARYGTDVKLHKQARAAAVKMEERKETAK